MFGTRSLTITEMFVDKFMGSIGAPKEFPTCFTVITFDREIPTGAPPPGGWVARNGCVPVVVVLWLYQHKIIIAISALIYCVLTHSRSSAPSHIQMKSC